MNEREIFLIKFYDCKKPNRYNLTDGGEGTSGHIVSPEVRAILSSKHKGEKLSNSTKVFVFHCRKDTVRRLQFLKLVVISGVKIKSCSTGKKSYRRDKIKNFFVV